jgi:uncharacterized membrane protein
MNFLTKIDALYRLLQAGKAVADRKALSDKANFVGLVAAFLIAAQSVAALYGIHIDLGATDVREIAQGIFNLITVVGIVASQLMHTASNDEAGVSSKRRAD